MAIDNEITISEIHEAYQNGDYTVSELVQYYLDRIDSLDQSGPELRAVLTVNPDAMDIARQLDQELEVGRSRGLLHGIPVLLKDNIDTGDKMACTAGANVMNSSFPLEDSPVAAQLRKAGAVILGKANLSEWANFHSMTSSSGWSALGGQTRNPYKLDHNPCGSSAGSGVGVAANLCVVAIGTETNGSIICPSNNNGIVGIKPTVGLISRTGIIPISFNHDTSGPMARTVTDAAITLGALTEVDPKDVKTQAEGRKAYQDYTQFLDKNGIKGKRIGYFTQPLNEDTTELGTIMEEAISYFREQGAEIVEVEEILEEGTGQSSFLVMQYEFKAGLNEYLAAMGDNATVKDLEEIVELTLHDPQEMQYHDHKLLELSQSRGGLEEEEYLVALEKMLKASQENGIDRVMDNLQLDAVIAPSGSPAWKTDLENGDTFGVFSSSPAAIAGYPSITVPMGQIDGLPVGISIFGRAWSEPILLEIAYSYEQGTQHRFSPTFSDDRD